MAVVAGGGDSHRMEVRYVKQSTRLESTMALRMYCKIVVGKQASNVIDNPCTESEDGDL